MEQAPAPADTKLVVPPVELRIAQYLLIALPVAMLLSTSAAVGLEIAAYMLFAWSPALRARLIASLKQPASVALAAFALALVLGTFHGLVPWQARLESLLGWRKLLLFFLAMAAFDGVDSKERFLKTFLAFCVAAALLSYFAAATSLTIHRYGGGVILKDHTVQGMMFAVGVGIALHAGVSAAYLAAAALLVSNIVFVTPGRNGYLALLIIAPLMRIRHTWKSGLIVLIACAALLAASSQARDRLVRGFLEFKNFQQATELSDMGFRVAMWMNATNIISSAPLLGVGTGSFEAAYDREVAGRTDWWGTRTNDPHNQYLKVWAEQGIFGLLTLLGFIALALRTRSTHARLAVAVLLAWCAASLFGSYFSRFVEGRFIFLWLGVLLAPVSARDESAGVAGPLTCARR